MYETVVRDFVADWTLLLPFGQKSKKNTIKCENLPEDFPPDLSGIFTSAHKLFFSTLKKNKFSLYFFHYILSSILLRMRLEVSVHPKETILSPRWTSP